MNVCGPSERKKIRKKGTKNTAAVLEKNLDEQTELLNAIFEGLQ